jgi:amino acid transporter
MKFPSTGLYLRSAHSYIEMLEFYFIVWILFFFSFLRFVRAQRRQELREWLELTPILQNLSWVWCTVPLKNIVILVLCVWSLGFLGFYDFNTFLILVSSHSWWLKIVHPGNIHKLWGYSFCHLERYTRESSLL